MEAMSVIQREHRAIAAVVHCFEQLLRETHSGSLKAPIDVFELILIYMRDFPDKLHHPKEDDYLFAALEKRAPKLKKAIGDLKRQHDEGDRLTIEMLEKLEVLKADPEGAFKDFEQAANEFIEFQRGHLVFEETKVMPTARKALTEQDWEAIDAAFADNDDPIFGSAPSAKFDKLFSQIVATAPEPWGLKSRVFPPHAEDDTLLHKLRERILGHDWH